MKRISEQDLEEIKSSKWKFTTKKNFSWNENLDDPVQVRSWQKKTWMKKWRRIRAGTFRKTMDQIIFTSINKALCFDRPQLSNSFRRSENTLLFPIFLLASAQTSTQSIIVLHILSIVCLSCFHSSRYNRHEDLKHWPSLITPATPDLFWSMQLSESSTKGNRECYAWTNTLKEKKRINLLWS